MPVTQWRLSERDKRKYLCAQRLGLLDQLTEGGWAALSAKDAGRIGGRMRKSKRS